jgi:hypothetical protein
VDGIRKNIFVLLIYTYCMLLKPPNTFTRRIPAGLYPLPRLQCGCFPAVCSFVANNQRQPPLFGFRTFSSPPTKKQRTAPLLTDSGDV